MFLKFTISSLSACALDLTLFTLFVRLLKGQMIGYAAAATVMARVISAVYNYLVNYKIVFRSTEKKSTSGAKYFSLALVQMGLSAVFVTAGIALLPKVPETAVKLVVDTVLFLISYMIQRRFIFIREEK